MPNPVMAHSAAADEHSGARTRGGGASAASAVATDRARAKAADEPFPRLVDGSWHAQGAASEPAGARRRRALGGFRRTGPAAAVCLVVMVSALGHLRAVEGLSVGSQRAKSYMRFGGMSNYAPYYDLQIRRGAASGEPGEFFNDKLQAFGGLSEQETAQAILAGASHMILKDGDSKLYGGIPAGYDSGIDTGITLEAFVRIRDKRVLAPPTQPDVPADRIGGSDIRLPIMGNMRHRYGPSDYFGQGYQLSCAYDGEPVCCAEAYTVEGAAFNPIKPDSSACVSIKPLVYLDASDPEQASSGDCSDAARCGTSWFHITGRFAGGHAQVRVYQSSAFYSQPNYTATSDKLQPFQHHYRAGHDVGKGRASDSIQIWGRKSSIGSEEPTNFALASSIPFARNGKVIDDLGDNLQYLFLRCDLDEVRIWVNSQGKSYVRSTEDHLRDIYEGVGRLH